MNNLWILSIPASVVLFERVWFSSFTRALQYAIVFWGLEADFCGFSGICNKRLVSFSSNFFELALMLNCVGRFLQHFWSYDYIYITTCTLYIFSWANSRMSARMWSVSCSPSLFNLFSINNFCNFLAFPSCTDS